MEDTTIRTGTVLFSANNNGNNKNFWDDSELIAHWDQTVEQYRKSLDNKQKDRKSKKKSILKKPIPKPIRPLEQAKPTGKTRPIKQTRPTDQTETIGQPMNDDSLSNLIMSWYYAGYYTALYQAQQQQQHQGYHYQQEQEEEEE